MATTTKALREKKVTLEILENLFETLEREEQYAKQEWRCVGKEEEQATNWKTGELLWEDEEQTIPKYKDKYEYVDKEELTEDDKIKLNAIENVRKALEKLI